MTVQVFVEIPKGSHNKYEQDEETGEIMLDRSLHGPEEFPFEYGYIKGTKGEDNDPLDVVLLTTFPTFPSCIVESEVIGYLDMEDEGGIDHKVVAVPTEKIDPRWKDVRDMSDLKDEQKAEIKTFFETYKKLEPNKWVKVQDFKSREEAEKLVEEARNR